MKSSYYVEEADEQVFEAVSEFFELYHAKVFDSAYTLTSCIKSALQVTQVVLADYALHNSAKSDEKDILGLTYELAIAKLLDSKGLGGLTNREALSA